MAGLRIRWRRQSAGLSPAEAASQPAGAAAPSEAMLGAFVWLAAALIVLLALAARLYNVDWDEDAHLHPDERHLTIVANDVDLPSSLGEYFYSDASPLNPYNRPGGGSFVYGTLPLFLTKATAALAGADDYDGLVIVGRYLSALLSAGAVLLVFLTARRLFGATAGLAGAFLLATAPLAIQQAHFFVVDPFLTFFMTALLYFAVRVAQEGRSTDYALAGLALGLGAACKVTALVVAPVVLLAAGQQAWPALRALTAQRDAIALAALRRPALVLVLAALVALLAFRVAQPYAFDAPSLSNLGLGLNDRWLDDQQQQRRLLGGEAAFPPSVQWIGRESYLYPLRAMIGWGMGPAFGVAGWLALLYGAYRLARHRDGRWLLPVAFVLVYFGFMGRQFSLYLRYFLPLYPALAVLAGGALVDVVRGVGALCRRLRLPALAAFGYSAVGVVLVLSALAGLAYLSVYSRPVTRLEADGWIEAVIPAGRTIAVEHWDDQIPRNAGGRYQIIDLPLYDADTPAKVRNLLDALADADYLVISSNRLLTSIPRNQVTYPVTSRYYELLLDERLGFRLVRSFTSYPSVLGVELADDGTEESWSSYDHPRVLIFERTPLFSRGELETLLGQGPFAEAALTPKQADRNGLLLSADDLETQRRGGTWSSVFSDSGLARSYPTLLWLLALEAAALALTPAALVLLRRLPDRGYLLAKPLGLLLLGYPVWLLASLKLVHFDQTSILVTLLILFGIGAAVASSARHELAGFLRANWRLVLVSEALFILAFLLFRELRLENPDLWHPYRGGEKPMDLAYLTAVTRSTTLPPYDPWFAGGYINYYYLGHFLTATLSKLTTIPPEVAFNLAVPTFFALTVAGAFSVSFNLAAAARNVLRRRPGPRPIAAWSPYAAGLLGAVFVAVAGNLDAVDQLAERLAAISAWRLSTPVPLLDAVVNSAGGLWQALVHGADLRPFDYWRSSRMLPPSISITEFPFFSFLFADLHAHMMAIPFEVLAIGLSLSLVLGRGADRRQWAVVCLLGLVVGSLRWLNSWDYPPFLLVALAALFIGERSAAGAFAATAPRLVAKGALLIGLSLLLYAPFIDGYMTPVSGLHASSETTPVRQYLAHFGVLVALIGAWLLYLALRAARASPLARRAAGRGARDRRWLVVALGVIGVLALVEVALVLAGQGLVAALLPVAALVLYLALREARLARPDSGLRLFVLTLVGLGLGLSAAVDVVTINGDIVRMNTVFKFYLHTWVVFALAAAFAAWQLLFVVWTPAFVAALRLPGRQAGPLPRLAAYGGSIALAALLLAALIYSLAATPARLDDRFADLPRTLDGMAYMQTAVYTDEKGTIDLSYDYEGIQWLRRNVEGTPAIVEGRTPLYRWGGRFSIYTGLPTVLGWDWHQTQQRGELAFMVERRAAEVDAFYADPQMGQALRFLRQYGVEYVIVGRVERLYYPAAGLRKLEAGLGGALEVAYSNPGLTIYRVRPSGELLTANASP